MEKRREVERAREHESKKREWKKGGAEIRERGEEREKEQNKENRSRGG